MAAASDIEAIERATVAAVVPQALEEIDGWLLAFDSGVVARAKSAVPLRHEHCDPALVERIEARYAAHGKPPLFRVADVPGWASIHGMRTALSRRGERIGARVMAALAQVAHERALPRIFLQVDGHNAPAVALYRRAGFVTAWPYAYWSRPTQA